MSEYRTIDCGSLRENHIGETVLLSGWVQKIRDKGGIVWIDLRDRFGITQVILEEGVESLEQIVVAKKLGREFVISIKGKVAERYAKNNKIPTGDIELRVEKITVLNPSKTPPFTIENETDGGEELRMKYRYLDIRRNPIKNNLLFRSKLSLEIRKFLDEKAFIEVETPYLIKSTPEGARDFVVPSRMNNGEFYALPQSPQTFKQLLMIGGLDKYYQIVKCFRDEDLRADRQPEFTQIDCEMSFVNQDDIINTFEGLTKHVFKVLKGIDLPDFPKMDYAEAMSLYGSDKPDIRFDMKFVDMNSVTKNKGFSVFDAVELVVAVNAKDCASYTRKQLDKLTDFVRRPQVGAKGLVYLKYNEDGSFKSSVDKFFDQDALKLWAEQANMEKGDLLLVLAGGVDEVRKQMSELRLHMGSELGLRNPSVFSPLWVVDFPLLEWDEETGRYHAMHHPFTSPKHEDFEKMKSAPGEVRANAYDLVVNGVELGGGSIRIHDKALQARMFDLLGFSPEQAQDQFGFLMNAFEYGAPPHAGIAFGFDRLCAVMAGVDNIREFIAFPKNNSGRDVMIDSPSPLSEEQLQELNLSVNE
ncbi:MAG: aspartyl-tRNA synthetase [Saprospiraceae bacterium]|jgi:aspartyl-tRNA synthetase